MIKECGLSDLQMPFIIFDIVSDDKKDEITRLHFHMEFYVTSSPIQWRKKRRQSGLTGTAAARGHGKLRCALHSMCFPRLVLSFTAPCTKRHASPALFHLQHFSSKWSQTGRSQHLATGCLHTKGLPALTRLHQRVGGRIERCRKEGGGGLVLSHHQVFLWCSKTNGPRGCVIQMENDVKNHAPTDWLVWLSSNSSTFTFTSLLKVFIFRILKSWWNNNRESLSDMMKLWPWTTPYLLCFIITANQCRVMSAESTALCSQLEGLWPEPTGLLHSQRARPSGGTAAGRARCRSTGCTLTSPLSSPSPRPDAPHDSHRV